MRWKFITPVAVVAALILAFNVLFLDAILKKIIIASGEAAFGAKVEIARLRTKFSDLSVRIDGFCAADKDDVWKNIFETEKIFFALRPRPLLAAKINIEEMSVEGVRFGTPRKTSGALPPRKAKKLKTSAEQEEPGAVSRLMGAIYEKGKSEVAALPAAASIAAAKKDLEKFSPDMIKLEDLESLRGAEEIKSALSAKYERNASRIKNLDFSATVKDASSSVAEASKIRLTTVEDARAAVPALEKLKTSRAAVGKSLEDLEAARRQALSDFGEEKDVLERLNALKNADLARISEKLKLPSLPSGNIAEALFGRVWLDRVNTAVRYIGLVRKYMPARKKTDKQTVRKRLKGRDIAFPLADVPPKFLIKKILVSGEFGSATAAPTLFKGTVTDVTSDPVLWGRPAVCAISGSSAGRSLDIKAVFDHTTPVSKDSVDISYKGLAASSLGIPESEYLPSFEKGAAAVSGGLSFVDEDIACRLGLAVGGLYYKMDASADDTRKILAEIWKGIDVITVDASLKGRAGDLKFSVMSNADRLIAERMKKLFGEKLAEAQEKIKAEINRLTAAKREEALKEFNSRKSALTSEYAARESELRAHSDAARAKVSEIEGKIKEIEEREKKRIEDEKRKAEEELKKRGAEKLGDIQKNLFK